MIALVPFFFVLALVFGLSVTESLMCAFMMVLLAAKPSDGVRITEKRN